MCHNHSVEIPLGYLIYQLPESSFIAHKQRDSLGWAEFFIDAINFHHRRREEALFLMQVKT